MREPQDKTVRGNSSDEKEAHHLLEEVLRWQSFYDLSQFI
jgi:hypothetical protein